MTEKFVLCPICGGKTRTKIRPDTEAKNLIVFCPKCKRESTVNVSGGKINEVDKCTD
mgnify:CR=1 FL=1